MSRRVGSPLPFYVENTDWMVEAQCTPDHRDIFFPSGGSRILQIKIDEAKRICNLCPVQKQCNDYAHKNHEKEGVWGGEYFGSKSKGRPAKVVELDDH